VSDPRPRRGGRRVAGTAAALAVAAAGAAPAEGSGGLEPLPEGPGLAAAYPGDRGLEAHPAVLFADGFETVSGTRLMDGVREGGRPDGWNHRWDRAWGGCRTAPDPAPAAGGGRCLWLAMPAGEGARGLGLFKRVPAQDRVFLRYRIRYGAEFPGAHHVGGSLNARAPGEPLANPGVVPDGTNTITVLLDHWSFDRELRPPGPLVAYVYHMDQRHEWGEQFYPSGKIQPGINKPLDLFGDAFVPRPDFIPETERWYTFEVMADAGAPGSRGGRVAFWVDGRLAADFPNLKFRTTPDLRFEWIGIGLYESRRNGPHEVWFDDVVAATRYIGPPAPSRPGG
jgi:hypothetical protein